MVNTRVAIAGGGIGGLAAARGLVQKGYSVISACDLARITALRSSACAPAG